MTVWRETDGGVIVAVRVTPRASRDGVDGYADIGDGRQALAIRVRAAPSDGAANEAVRRTLAEALDVPRRDVALISGATARLKQWRISGDTFTIAARLQELVQDHIMKDKNG